MPVSWVCKTKFVVVIYCYRHRSKDLNRDGSNDQKLLSWMGQLLPSQVSSDNICRGRSSCEQYHSIELSPAYMFQDEPKNLTKNIGFGSSRLHRSFIRVDHSHVCPRRGYFWPGNPSGLWESLWVVKKNVFLFGLTLRLISEERTGETKRTNSKSLWGIITRTGLTPKFLTDPQNHWQLSYWILLATNSDLGMSVRDSQSIFSFCWMSSEHKSTQDCKSAW